MLRAGPGPAKTLTGPARSVLAALRRRTLGRVTAVQKVAMGLVVVVLSARFGGWDALPDPVGWALVIAGVWPLRHRLPQGGSLLALAGLAAVVSVPLVLPAVQERLPASGQWGLSVPQTAFCLLLCGSLAAVTERAGEKESGRFALLRTAYAVLLVAPVLVYGGGVDALATPVAVVSVVANVALVYYLFAVSRRASVLADDSPAGARG